MRKFVNGLQKKSEAYHEPLHMLLGALCGVIMVQVFDMDSYSKLIMVGVLGGLLPDVDHLLFIFLYGRKTEYSKIIKGLMKQLRIRHLYKFVRVNHKYNTSIYSHNMLSVAIAFSLFYYLYSVKDNAAMSTFFLSWMVHYIFDIFEDYLFFKKINPNWYLKFSKDIKKDLEKIFEHEKPVQ